MKKEIVVGVVAAVSAAFFTCLATLWLHGLDKIELQVIADKIIQEDSFRKILLSEFKKDGEFKGKDGKDGSDGQNGISMPKKNGTNWCSEFSDSYQICWGYNDVANDGNFFRAFEFTFVNPFSTAPIVVNGISVDNLHDYDDYIVVGSITNSQYKGSIKSAESRNMKYTGPVRINYIAVGKK